MRHLFAGIVRGVHELHTREIAHCDLKLSNVVLDNDLRPLLIDYGNASACTGKPQ